MKRVICALLMVPIALCVIHWGVGIFNGISSGELNVFAWIGNHKTLLIFIACYIGLQFVGPFKKAG